MRSLVGRIFSLALALVFVAGNALAQGERGAITGTVADASGGVVPEATIIATDSSTGVNSTAKTSSAGLYRLSAVPPGTYRVQAQKEGFKKGVTNNVVVGVAAVVTVDFTLQVGSTTQTVTVTSEAPLLTPDTPEVGTSMTPEEFATLPIDLDDGERQLQQFIFSSLPGTVGSPFAGSVNGGQLFSSEILIDGISIARYDLSGGSLSEFTPAFDATGEFKVQMTNYSAAYGETGGGVENFGMKSGSNEYHGSVYEYFKNPHLNATGFSINALPEGSSAKQKEPLHENNFGATFGGPLSIPHVYNGKNRTFFFLSFQGDRQRDPSPGDLKTQPTVLMKQGNFSEWLGPQLAACGSSGTDPCVDAIGRPVYDGAIYDPTTTRSVGPGHIDPVTGKVASLIDPTTGLPATSNYTLRDPFPGNVIPSNEFSKASAILLPLFPTPVNGNLFRNYPSLSTCCPRLDVNIWSVKIDHVINEKHRLSSFFNWNDRPRSQSHGTLYPPLPGFPLNPLNTQDVHGRMFRLSEDWTINDHTLNHFAIGYNRFTNANGLGEPPGWNSRLGITGVSDECMAGFNFLKIDQLGTYGGGCHGFDPSESYIWLDTVNYIRGKHNFTFGAEIRRYRYNVRDTYGQNGSFNFSDRETSLPGFYSLGSSSCPSSAPICTTGHPFASFVLGAVDEGSRSVQLTTPGYRSKLGVFYAQDDWKATRKLTLNFGLRWEIPGAKKEAHNRQSGFDPTVPNSGADGFPGALVFLGHCQGCNGRDSFQDSYYKEFAPRFGFAYAATQKLVVRGGYGISYGPPILNNFGSQNIFGFNGGINLARGSGPTGIFADPVVYWTPLVGAPLPSVYTQGNGIGMPPFKGTLPAIDPTIGNGSTVDFLPRKSLAQPYVQNWSLGFQYQLPAGVLLEANYVGSKGTRLLQSLFSYGFNQVPSKYIGLGDILADDFATDLTPGSATAATLASYGITRLPYPSFSDIVGQGLRPFPQFQSIVNNYPEFGSSTYHSLQVTGRKRGHGLSFIAAYTLSKTLDNTDSALYYPSGGYFYAFAQDYYNRKAEKSVASFDFPQFLKLTWIYELPFGQGKRWLSSSGHLNRLVSGWKISAIQQYHSGDVLFIQTSQCTGIFNGPYGDGCGVRADVLPGVPQRLPLKGLDSVNGTPYLNPAAFADPPLSPINGFPLRLGSAPRFLPNVRGPGHAGESFGILKDTRISERVNIQFRANFFNLLNRTGVGDPDINVDDGPTAFGRIFGAQNGARNILLALRLEF